MRLRLFLVPVLMVAVLGACGGDDDDSASPTTTAASGSTGGITIEGSTFAPNPLDAQVGDSISVINKDNPAEHSVTADDGSFDTGKFSSGTKTIKLTKVGTIAYHCEVHPSSMKGVIEVS